MLECLLDALIDTIKLIPYLLITFLLLEWMEHKLSKKTEKVITKYKKLGPLLGGIFGGFPQCGFSAMGANLYTSGIITRGTLIAIFLSTSDEMLPIMISEQVSIPVMLEIVGFKIIIGILIGFIVDLLLKNKFERTIGEICDEEHCHCKNGIIKSSLIHTLKTTGFILLANVLIGVAIYFIGTENLENLLKSNNLFVYFLSSLIGLIPNCAASVVITELYLSNFIPIGVAIAGLLTSSGIGILLLFKNNKYLKDNLLVLSIIYTTGVIVGFIIDCFL